MAIYEKSHAYEIKKASNSKVERIIALVNASLTLKSIDNYLLDPEILDWLFHVEKYAYVLIISPSSTVIDMTLESLDVYCLGLLHIILSDSRLS